MLITKTYKVVAESYAEEQAILNLVPEAIWINLDGRTVFLIPEAYIDRVKRLHQERP
jgi:hypothetical protein